MDVTTGMIEDQRLNKIARARLGRVELRLVCGEENWEAPDRKNIGRNSRYVPYEVLFNWASEVVWKHEMEVKKRIKNEQLNSGQASRD